NPCKNGSFCPTGSIVPDPFECTIGFHCPLGSSKPKPCPAGSFTNSSGRDQCDPCPEGFYCFPLELARNESIGYRVCPRGYYCPQGTGLDWRSCPAGTYSDRLGLYKESQCQDCDAGKFCDGRNLTSPTDFCAAGYFCTIGVSVRKPYIDGYNLTNSSCPNPTFLGQYTGIGDICPPGTFCTEGSNVPKDCTSGSYNDESGQEKCKLCPAGYFCLGRTVTFINNTCPGGHYCPINTTQPFQFPCHPGTYNNLTGQKTVSSCVPCPKGSYCEGYGNSWPTGLCSAGWWCNGSATSNMTTTHGGKCQPGYYCPQGSSYPTPCDGGKFCDITGLSKPKGNCSAGYFCKLKAISSTPSDETGGKCPSGHYCPKGSTDPTPCNPGTYYGGDGATSASACVPCTNGSFCNSSGLAAPDGQCAAGYYCPAGQSVGTPSSFVCPLGHKCIVGSGSPRNANLDSIKTKLNKILAKNAQNDSTVMQTMVG
ncbi:PREDICTED: sushi, von Willebrand factor type A, EGF and pentraxin domain-containing protein 1-like, partial [Acropora digitifera]|uniref:sushi, von Willebrand factor type A, EGF and pentraxin domain-containing protein 1-like n=1 Tax=Acropora digitifera TaxID=70779 RepID=UPI00077A7676